jgi:hypothetical protein
MYKKVLLIGTCVALGGCSSEVAHETVPGLTHDAVISMSRATQEKYCAVLTEVAPNGPEGYDRTVPDQLIAMDSEIITDRHSIATNVVAAERSPAPPSMAPRGWKLTAPCIVWRPALVAGEVLPTVLGNAEAATPLN